MTMGHEVLSFIDGSSTTIKYWCESRTRTSRCSAHLKTSLTTSGCRGNLSTSHDQDLWWDTTWFGWVLCDDLIIKTKRRADHIGHLRIVFERLCIYKLKMNPMKCAFSVSSDKLLGFIVRYQGIKIDLDEIKAIKEFASTLEHTGVEVSPGQDCLHPAFQRQFLW